MSYFDSLLLGVIQGLTEFLPVSSSGHLVLAEYLLHAKIPGVAFELILHFGTLLSVIIYFRKRIMEIIFSLLVSRMASERKMILYLIVGSIPAGLAGVLLKDFLEAAFSSPAMTSLFLIITGIILLATALVRKGTKELDITRSFIIGIGQAIAILPGISRSGTTISAGLFTGVRAEAAAEFSFLLSIPAIAGAIIFKFREIAGAESLFSGQFMLGGIASFLCGLLAVYLLLSLIKKGKFRYFGVYCLIVGLLGLVYFA